MVQTKQAKVSPAFKLSVLKNDSSSATVRLSGEFTGEKEQIEEIQISFRRGGLLDEAKEVNISANDTFYVNGHSAFLARAIRNSSRGKKIIFRDPNLVEVAHFFKKI